MKEVLERILVLDATAKSEDVELLIAKLENAKNLLKDVSIKSLEAVVKHFKEESKELKTKDLLEWMNENDQVEFETDDCKVSIKTYVSSKVIDAELAFAWLNKNQYGDLIKDTLDFPKGELTKEVEASLEEMGLSYTKKSGIHPQTLKKVISDRLKDAEELPDEDTGFKISYYDECAVKEK